MHDPPTSNDKINQHIQGGIFNPMSHPRRSVTTSPDRRPTPVPFESSPPSALQASLSAYSERQQSYSCPRIVPAIPTFSFSSCDIPTLRVPGGRGSSGCSNDSTMGTRFSGYPEEHHQLQDRQIPHLTNGVKCDTYSLNNDICSCYDDPVYGRPRREAYNPNYDHSELYVLKTVVPGRGGRHASLRNSEPFNCQEFSSRCLGNMLYGTAVCLAGSLEAVCLCFGQFVRQVSGSRHHRRRFHAPYAWNNYEIDAYEYDMVVYRRPKRNWFEKLLGW